MHEIETGWDRGAKRMAFMCSAAGGLQSLSSAVFGEVGPLVCSHLSVHNCVCPPAPLKPRHYGAIEVSLLLLLLL